MHKSFKYRLYPTKKQVTDLNGQLELCRWVYNQTLELRKNSWEQDHISVSLYDTHNMIPGWIEKIKPELKKVHSQVLRNTQLRVDLAFKSFFRRVKAKQNPGYPRFKGYGRYDSIAFPQSGFRLDPQNSTLYLSKTGRVNIILHRPTQGTIKTCTVSKTFTGKWFVSFSCEIDKPTLLHRTGKVVGMDLGLRTFIQVSDGVKVKNPRFFKKAQKDLAKAQRKLSKFPKGDKSLERKQAKKIVAKVHERISNKRDDFCHKTALELVRNYDFIAHEDLNIQGMLEEKKYSKSIADASWAKLIQMLSYKAEEAGKTTVAVNPRNTSQQCSRCLVLVPKDLGDRIHNCPHCGLSIDRDLNASFNILRLGLESVEQPKLSRKAKALVGTQGSPRL
jgi:putative transposase